MSDDPFIVVDRKPDGSASLRLSGDVTVFCAGRLHRAALEAASPAADVSVECEGLQSLDFAAAQILFALRHAVTSSGKAFRISGVSAELTELLEMVELGQDSAATGAACVSQPTPERVRATA